MSANTCVHLYHPNISDKEGGDRYLARVNNPNNNQVFTLQPNPDLWKIEGGNGNDRRLKHVDTGDYLRMDSVSYQVRPNSGDSCASGRNDRGRISAANGFLHLTSNPDDRSIFTFHGYDTSKGRLHNIRHKHTRQKMESDPDMDLCDVHPGHLRPNVGGWSSNAFKRGQSNLTRHYDWGRWKLEPVPCPSEERSPVPPTSPVPPSSPCSSSPCPSSPTPTPPPRDVPPPPSSSSFYWNWIDFDDDFFKLNNGALYVYVGGLVLLLLLMVVLLKGGDSAPPMMF